MENLVLISLYSLAFSLFVSISLMSLHHVFAIIPGIVTIKDIEWRRLPAHYWALISFMLGTFLSLLFNRDIIQKGFSPLTKIKYFIIAILLTAAIKKYQERIITQKHIRIFLNLLIVMATISTLIGLIGMSLSFNIVKWYPGIIERNSGIFGNVMTYAHSMTFFLLINIGLMIEYQKIKQYISKKILIFSLVVNILGLYFSYTRGAWIAFLLSVPFFLFKKNKKLFLGITFSVFIIGALSYSFVPSINGLFAKRKEISDNVRIGYWKASVEAFKERPVFGIGFLNFEPLSVHYKEKYHINNDGFYGHAHNNFLEILSTTGLFGIISYLLWLVFWLKNVYLESDIVSNITFVFIIDFVIGGLTQRTIFDGSCLFFIMLFYILSNVKKFPLKSLER